MFTKCPECNSVFRITEELLEIADGLVRCGICDAIFDGADHLHEDNQSSEYEELTTSEYEDEFDDNEDRFSTSDEDTEDKITSDSYDVHQADENTLINSDSIPTVIRDDFGGGLLPKANNPMQIALWTVGSIMLALFFLGQITYWQKVDVLPRSWVENFCIVVGCASNEEYDLTSIRILNRNIFTHPNAKDALMITASFVNEHKNAQPFPLLQIVLLNTHGEIVAIRRFTPAEYLVNKDLVTTQMQPDQPIGARLEVFDPGSTVIAYEIKFY